MTKFRSKAYRHAFAEANTGNRVALQIRAMREHAGMSQAELAKKLGTRQSAVARLEDLNYGKHSVAILHRIAAIFDVAAWVEFVSYSTLIRRTTDLSAKAITPKPYSIEFDENGEPNTNVDLLFDGSAICLSNYVTPMGKGTFTLFTPGTTGANLISQK